jgi:hypothetical protein
MSENAVGYLLLLTGALCVAAFVLLNFRLDKAWIHKPTAGGGPVPMTPKRTRLTVGTIEAALFMIGITLFTAGCAIFLTRGYGSF